MEKMDKDTIILKHQQQTSADIENEVSDLQKSNENQVHRLAEMQAKLEEMGSHTPKKRPFIRKNKKTEQNTPVNVFSYDSLFEEAYSSLAERGLDPDSINYSNLVSNEELEQIIRELNAPYLVKKNGQKLILLLFSLQLSLAVLWTSF